MTNAIEIKKENGDVIKMELVIAGAANLTEMDIVKVTKFNETIKIGSYTVNNDTDEEMLNIYVTREKDVTKAYGAVKARNGIAYTTATKTFSTMKHYKSAKFMEKALKAYELTLEEVKNAMETLKATKEEEIQKETTTENENPKFFAFFCTFNGDEEDDVTTSFDTVFEEFTTAKEAYDACESFKNTCDFHYAGCYIEDSKSNWIYNHTYDGDEYFYLEGKEVDFDTFNAKIEIVTKLELSNDLNALFDEYEEKRLIRKQTNFDEDPLKWNDAYAEEKEVQQKIKKILFKTPKKKFAELEVAIGREYFIRDKRVEARLKSKELVNCEEYTVKSEDQIT